MAVAAREWHLVQRPAGLPDPEVYRLVERDLPALAEGELLVRNVSLSVDPYMRPRMDDRQSYTPKYELNQALTGGAVGQVVESTVERIPAGTWVLHQLGWRDFAILRPEQLRTIERGQYPSSYHLGVLGMPGFTAYVGLFAVAGFEQGESVFVSGAGGAVGGLVGQFAKITGAERVVGSAGTADKVAHAVDELGFDAAFNYRDGVVEIQLRNVCPNGFEVYFDNVGGDHLAAALEVINDFGRIALCGTISSYNASARSTIPGNMFRAVAKRLRLQGFVVSDHEHLRREFVENVTGWLASGHLTYRESVTWGLETMPQAFAGMLTGANTGKAIIRLSDD